MSLSQAPKGEAMLVTRVAVDDKMRRHLGNLGILAGSELIPLAYSDGNMIVRVHDARIAIDSTVAENIIVRKMPSFA
mgnify:CR=1 FL=1